MLRAPHLRASPRMLAPLAEGRIVSVAFGTSTCECERVVFRTEIAAIIPASDQLSDCPRRLD